MFSLWNCGLRIANYSLKVIQQIRFGLVGSKIYDNIFVDEIIKEIEKCNKMRLMTSLQNPCWMQIKYKALLDES